MRAVQVLVAVLLSASGAAGCSCGSVAPLDVPVDGGLGLDASPDGAADTGLDTARLDAPLRAPLCGPVVRADCPTQNRDTVSACGAEGLVFFDGAHCQETPVADCGPVRGAFSSFEECAVACEVAGHCDASKLFYNTSPVPAGCMGPPPGSPDPCPGGAYAYSEVDLSCLFGDGVRCTGEPGFYSCIERLPLPYTDAPRVWLGLRRTSLLPFVSRCECDNALK